MATLKNSRGKFFHAHKMPPDRSFWLHFIETVYPEPQLILSRYAPAALAKFKAWRPERSNCEELTLILEDLTLSLPDDWKALARNLFVGRVISGEVNAQAWTHKQAGIVEITLQYTHILGAYAATYNEYFLSMKTLFEALIGDSADVEALIASLNNRLERPWNEIGVHRSLWRDPRVLLGGCAAITEAVAPDRIRLVEDMVLAAESFIVAHELSHHLLGHTTSGRDKRSAKRILHGALEGTEIYQIMVPLNSEQRQEVEADALAFLVCANAISETPSFRQIYHALAGSVLALVAAAHVKSDWIADDISPTHPGFLTRMQVISELTNLLAADRSIDKETGHPFGFLAQLQTFAALALNAFFHEQDPESHQRAGLLDLAGHIFRLADELKSAAKN